MITLTRETVSIPSVDSGILLDVWLYKPSSTSQGPFPVVVAGHGLTLIKDAGLAAFGEQWASVGWASLILDYRGFGESGSKPEDRNVVSIKRQLEDFRAVIKWARSPERATLFRQDKVVVMGSALSGLCVVELASNAKEEGIAGAMAHCPILDGFPIFKAVQENAEAFKLVTSDFEGSQRGDPPLFIPAVGKPGDPAFLTSPSSWDGFTAMFSQGSTPFLSAPNLLAPRMVLELREARPCFKLRDVDIPILVIMAEEDDLIPASVTREAVEQAGCKIRLEISPGGHFDVMKGGKGFDANIAAQLSFLTCLI